MFNLILRVILRNKSGYTRTNRWGKLSHTIYQGLTSVTMNDGQWRLFCQIIDSKTNRNMFSDGEKWWLITRLGNTIVVRDSVRGEAIVLDRRDLARWFLIYSNRYISGNS